MEDILKILISTDNHMGYQEKDKTRGQDSFIAMEEVFQKATDLDVDLLLLGGDVFHDNSPSTSTLNAAFQIFSRFIIGKKDHQFSVLESHTDINFLNPDVNIKLPVFAIHGNHDDPSFDTNISSIDLLKNAQFLNYMYSRMENDTLVVEPTVLNKGNTFVAIYGIGYIKDEFFNRLLRNKKVVFMQPQTTHKYFNILVIHQNRFKGSASKSYNYILDSAFPNFIDLIIWGHEHESEQSARRLDSCGYSIIQPGSTVATSFIEAESKPKSVCLLEVKKIGFRDSYHPLLFQRPMRFAKAELSEFSTDREAEEYLKNIFGELVQSIDYNSNPNYLRPPLIRIKAETSDRNLRVFEINHLLSEHAANKDVVMSWKRKKGTSAEVQADDFIQTGEMMTEILGILQSKMKDSGIDFRLFDSSQFVDKLRDIVSEKDDKSLEKLFNAKVQMANETLKEQALEPFDVNGCKALIRNLDVSRDEPTLKRSAPTSHNYSSKLKKRN